MNKYYIKFCPKCKKYMIQEIRYDKYGYSYLIWKCTNSKCNYEEVKNGNG